jgi:hypothetical protein
MTRQINRLERPEFAGGMEFRFFEVDITNYDSDGGGDGEAFNAADAGMSRLQHVDAQVDPGTSSGANSQVNAVAQYDYDTGSIRLFYGGTDGAELSEVGSNADEGAVVRIKAIGR